MLASLIEKEISSFAEFNKLNSLNNRQSNKLSLFKKGDKVMEVGYKRENGIVVISFEGILISEITPAEHADFSGLINHEVFRKIVGTDNLVLTEEELRLTRKTTFKSKSYIAFIRFINNNLSNLTLKLMELADHIEYQMQEITSIKKN